jgi:TolA-binding protein
MKKSDAPTQTWWEVWPNRMGDLMKVITPIENVVSETEKQVRLSNGLRLKKELTGEHPRFIVRRLSEAMELRAEALKEKLAQAEGDVLKLREKISELVEEIEKVLEEEEAEEGSGGEAEESGAGAEDGGAEVEPEADPQAEAAAAGAAQAAASVAGACSVGAW